MKKIFTLATLAFALAGSGCYSKMPEPQPQLPIQRMECTYIEGNKASDVASCYCLDPNKTKQTEQYYKC